MDGAIDREMNATRGSRPTHADASRKLRIAFVTETYPPEVNGVSLTLAQVVDGLHRRDHDLQLIRPRQQGDARRRFDDGPMPRLREVLMRGLPIPRYPHLRMGLPAKKALVRLWSSTRPDVVHIATEGPLGWSALHAARQLELPITSDFRTNFHAYSRHYGIGWLRAPIMAYLRRFHNAAFATMVPTDALRTELEAAGFRNVTVISRGVDGTLFDPARRSAALRRAWDVQEDDLVVACIGRLAAEKNLDVVRDAFEAIRVDAPRAKLLFVGDGPLEGELKKQIPEALFAGRRIGEDLAAHYASADLFLFPSVTETFGNVTIEAMASGLPVVAFDYAAAARLIRPGGDGVLVPFGDRTAFVEAARRAAGDRAHLAAMGRAARERALGQSWDGVNARFGSALRAVIHAQPAAGSSRGGLVATS